MANVQPNPERNNSRNRSIFVDWMKSPRAAAEWRRRYNRRKRPAFPLHLYHSSLRKTSVEIILAQFGLEILKLANNLDSFKTEVNDEFDQINDVLEDDGSA